jgi:hypothetical protein
MVLMSLLAIEFAALAVSLAANRPFWMDEVLAVWTARLPSAAAIWGALEKGAEFSPPLYHLLLHSLVRLGLGNSLDLRLPSVAAVAIVALATFVIVRRRYPTSLAALAAALCLASGLFEFAVQARQYALVAACFAGAVLLWDIPAQKPPSPARALALALCVSAAIGMHFYAVLLAAALAGMEVLWALINRRVRWRLAAAILAGGGSIVLWLPIMRKVSSFNTGDTGAPLYYARPSLGALLDAYGTMIGPGNSLILLYVAAALLLRRAGPRARQAHPEDASAADHNLDLIVGVGCAVPLLVFFFSWLVTGTFNERYVIAGVFAFAILIVRCVAVLPRASATCCVLIAASGLAMAQAGAVLAARRGIEEALAVLRRAPSTPVIVTGNGLRFLELAEAAEPALARRLVFLTSPRGVVSPDPTNEHQVERWRQIRPDLAIADPETFLAHADGFLVFHDSSAVDVLPEWLVGRGLLEPARAHDDTAWLAEAKPRAR